LNRLEKAVRKYGSALAILALLTLSISLGACKSSSDDADEVKTVGVLQISDKLDPKVNGLKEGLAELEFAEGENINYLYRTVNGDISLFEGYVKEMIDGEVDVIVAFSTKGAIAAQAAANGAEIPVIFNMESDPQAAGLVESLGRPGGNMSGVAGSHNLTGPKRLEMLLLAVPDIERILVVHSDTDTVLEGIELLREAALVRGTELVTIQVTSTEQTKAAYASIQLGEIDAVFIPADPIVISAGASLLQLVKRDGIPAMSLHDLGQGEVMSYGPQMRDVGAQLAVMVAKVLNGDDPGTMPVERPRRYWLTLYLGTAKRIGYEFSDTALSLADVLVEN